MRMEARIFITHMRMRARVINGIIICANKGTHMRMRARVSTRSRAHKAQKHREDLRTPVGQDRLVYAYGGASRCYRRTGSWVWCRKTVRNILPPLKG